MAFTLEDRSSTYGEKLWAIRFDLEGEKVNKFSREVMLEFETWINKLHDMGSRGEIAALVMVSGKDQNFIAGADINLIQSAKDEPAVYELARKGQELLNRWEDLPFPTIVAIDGSCVGGGCELSLASRAILMSNQPQARIGLPEVLLGIIPGMGGCVRLPRKVGIATAMDMILTGKTLTGERAAKAGLADACLVRENFEDNAFRWVKTNLSKLRRDTRLAREPKLGGMGGLFGKLLELNPVGRAFVFSQARKGVMTKTRGQYPAPLEAIRTLQDTGAKYGPKLKGKLRDRALIREAEGFGKAWATDASKNLIRLFFLTETVKKSTGVAGGKSDDAKKVTTAGVLGAGVMGGGIAQLLADKGTNVRMKDISVEGLALGVSSALRVFKSALKKRRITPRELQQKLNHIAPTLDYSGFKSADLVIEAIVEKLELKQKVFQELEGQVRDDCVIASNTSSLSISKMQSVMARPERFAGMHFFNPVHRMPLVEVIRGEKSSDAAIGATVQLALAMGKTPIVVNDCPGFLVNRVLFPYFGAFFYLMRDGVEFERIDKVMEKFGWPMGPAYLLDVVGIDTAHHCLDVMKEGFPDRMNYSFETVLDLQYGAKRFGQKNGKGFFNYAPDPKGRPQKKLDPEVYTLIKPAMTGGAGKQGKDISDEEIVDRMMLAMLLECSRCLEDKIVETPREADLALMYGLGFPAFRGGIFLYADEIGAKTIVEKSAKYESVSPMYKVTDQLKRLASVNGKFYE